MWVVGLGKAGCADAAYRQTVSVTARLVALVASLERPRTKNTELTPCSSAVPRLTDSIHGIYEKSFLLRDDHE